MSTLFLRFCLRRNTCERKEYTRDTHKERAKMDANKQRQKGLLLFLSSFLVVCHCASRQIHFQSKSSSKNNGENNSFLNAISSIKMELFMASMMALCATFSETIGAFGNFREIREERGEIPGLCVERMNDFSHFWHRAKAMKEM